MRLRELAVAAGVDPGALIDEWRDRVQALEYLEVPPAEAERAALEHVAGRLR